MLILAILPLLATVVSASNNQIPLGGELDANTGATESEIDVSPFVFTSLQGLLRQWQNVFAPTGHTIIPGIVPAHTMLYHARRDMETPPSPEWFAFDVEMSYGIIAPFGVCIMNTYAATRPLNVLYFDGMSAALGRNGTLDSQNVFLYEQVVDDDWGHRPGGGDKETLPGSRGPGDPGVPGGPLYGEYKRAKELCDWANGLGEGVVEGFVRMNSGFELLWCDFNSSAIELVSRLNVTIPALEDTTSIFESEESEVLDQSYLEDHYDNCPPLKGHRSLGEDNQHHCPSPRHEGDHYYNSSPPEHETDCRNPPKGDHPLLRDSHRSSNKENSHLDYHHCPQEGDHTPTKDGKKPGCHYRPLKGEHPPPTDGDRLSKGDHPPPDCHHGHHPPRCGHQSPGEHCSPKDDHRPPNGDHPHHPPPGCHHPHHPPPRKHWGSAVVEFLRRLFSHHWHRGCHHGHSGHPPKHGHGGDPPCKGKKPPHKGHPPPPKHCPRPPKHGCPPKDGDHPPPYGEPPYGEPPNGSYPHFPHGPRSPFSIESRWEWVRSATWHYNLAPENRVILDYCRMTSYYNVSIPGRAPAGTPNAKRLHRLKTITPEKARLVKNEVERNLLSYQEENSYCSGIDWRETADGITRRYFARVIELRGLLSKAEHHFRYRNGGTELIKVTKRIRGLSHSMVMPFFQMSDQSIEAAQKRCVKDYTGRIDFGRIGSSERMLVSAVEGVMENVCKVIFGVYENFMAPINEKAAKEWSEKVEALVGWVDWAGWHRCNDACGWDEVCAIPLWPILGTPWNQGADDELLLNPRCIGIEFMEGGKGGWGPGRPPS